METCSHCGQPMPHVGTSWRESSACRYLEAGYLLDLRNEDQRLHG